MRGKRRSGSGGGWVALNVNIFEAEEASLSGHASGLSEDCSNKSYDFVKPELLHKLTQKQCPSSIA